MGKTVPRYSIIQKQTAPKEPVLISLFHVAVLLDNLYRASSDPLVGFEDADRTLEEMHTALNRYCQLPKEIVESALWCCNLLHEKGAFFHPQKETFETFLRRALPKHAFDKVFNLLTEKKLG